MTRMSQKGFTLIELMIVVVIIGVLASIAIPKFGQVSKSSKEAEASPILKQLYTLQMRHFQMTDQYATSISELEGGTSNFAGKYYDFALAAGASGSSYIACGTPRDPNMGLRSFRVDNTGTVGEGTC